ncbi:ninein-like protein isoform X2 [Carettochelys insculpta]|uniref:ninein-like protein isoform X2 n=1 Tax=Carettochelys insculpta TaxID=44489 RepID=UPI003EB892AB
MGWMGTQLPAAKVNFEEFKAGFMAVLSSNIDLGVSDEETSYLEPAVPDAVKPKYMNGAKWYGRWTSPERPGTEVETTEHVQDQQVKTNVKSQLRPSASLESMESLKSSEEAESAKEPQDEMLEAQGRMSTWNPGLLGSPRGTASPCPSITEGQIRGIWEQLDIGNTGYLSKCDLATVCRNIGLKELEQEEFEDLFCRLDRDGDGRVSFQEFEFGLSSHGPVSLPVSSTPIKQPRQLPPDRQVSEEKGHGTAAPSLLSSCVYPCPLSSLDNGSGFVSPAQLLSVWAQEGVENCKEILQSLDFSLDERVSLEELALAFHNELMASKSGVQHAAFASYKHELHYLEALVEQVSSERDKVRLDLEKAEKRNLQLVKEVDDRHAALEHHHERKLKDLEQDYRGKLSAVKAEVETERAFLLQQAADQQTKLEADIKLLQGEKTSLREKLASAVQETRRLQSELAEAVEKLSESEKQVSKLQKELDFMVRDKLGMVDPRGTELLHQEECFAEIIREYELQSRELRDKNDELQAELEKLHSQLQQSQYRRAWHMTKANKLGGRLPPDETLGRDQPLLVSQQLPAAGKKGILCLEAGICAASIETELLLEQLKEQLHDLKIQLETKVNHYEREIELMKRSFEKERKDIEQGFKVEISELEEQKGDLEELNMKYQEVIDGLKDQLQKCTPSQELEKQSEQERAEVEQYYAKEMCSLGQQLARERDRLEEELRMQHKNELRLMRTELRRVSEENALLRTKLGRFQQEVEEVEEASNKQRKQIDELQREKEKALAEAEELNQLNETYRQEISRLSARTLQLSSQLSDLHLQSETSHRATQLLSQRLSEMQSQREEEAAVARQLQETSSKLEQEYAQCQSVWQAERELLRQQLQESSTKVSQVQELEVELECATQECKTLKLTTAQLREELEESQDQLLEANTSLSRAQSQHRQDLQHLTDQLEHTVSKESLAKLQSQRAEEQRKVQQLEDALGAQAEQASRQLAALQGEHERLLRAAEERAEELERDVRNGQRTLREKVTQFQEQCDRNAKGGLLLKDLYVENAQLVKALQAAEQRQKIAEKKNLALEEKLFALNQLVRKMAQASLGM